MKNILLLMPYGSVGGMERLAFTFYHHYKSLGYNVTALKIIKLESDIINFGNDELSLSTVDFFQMSSSARMLFYAKAPLRIRKIIKERQITHSITFGDMANFFSSLTLTKEFKVGSIHALKSVEFVNQSFLNKLFKLSYRTSYRFFDKMVCISKAIKQDLIENCAYAFPENLQVIYNPHNLDEIRSKGIEQLDNDVEAELFSHPVIIFVGRLAHQKSPWHLINSFALLQKERPDVNLVFIGDGDAEVSAFCHKRVQDLGLSAKVHFLGRKPNPYKYISKSAVLALSSYYEGTPNVIVEAIALGIPVVSSRCTEGILELMCIAPDEKQHDGLIITDAGIITPNFFKGVLGIPTDNNVINEELLFSKAMLDVLDDASYRDRLIASSAALLQKFEIGKVAEDYLAPHQGMRRYD